jgi:hypothetical protein
MKCTQTNSVVCLSFAFCVIFISFQVAQNSYYLATQNFKQKRRRTLQDRNKEFFTLISSVNKKKKNLLGLAYIAGFHNFSVSGRTKQHKLQKWEIVIKG